jgi:hypothetical protein
MTDVKKDISWNCWWCGGPAKRRERTELWNRRNPAEKRSVLLCEGCVTKPERTVWLGWRRKDDLAYTPR